MREKKDSKIEAGFMIGSLIALISILFGTLGFFWLMKIPPARDLFFLNWMDSLSIYDDICCGLTIFFILMAFAGIMQANYSLIRSIKKK